MRLMMAWIVSLCISGVMVTGVAAARPEGKAPVPAAEDTATAALLKSPRHGEWVDVPMGEGETPVRTWVVYPERAGEAPVVVVIHEIFGLTDWIRAVSDALAAEGYVAVAPDLLSGKGPGGGGTKAFAGDAVREAVQGLSNDEVVRRLDAVRSYTLKLPATSMKSAAVGFCWGGNTAFTYAMKQAGLSAVVVYYGTGPDNAAAAQTVKSPVLGLYGGDDARVTATVPATQQAMKEAGRLFEAIIFDGAGHGFLRQQNGRNGANAKAAAASWASTLAFLQTHLNDAGGDK